MLFLQLILLTGCQKFAKNNLGQELTDQDFQTITSKPPNGSKGINYDDFLGSTEGTNNEKITNTLRRSAIPEQYKKHVSIEMSEDDSLYVSLQKLGSIAGVDVQIESRIKTYRPVNYTATDKRFIDILENICYMAKLRYKISHGMLFIEKDTPFSKSYNVQFLNLKRLSENKISSATDIFANSICCSETEHGVGNNMQNQNGSNTSVTMNSETDFWKELETNLKTILLMDETETEDVYDNTEPQQDEEIEIDDESYDSMSSCGKNTKPTKSYFTIHKQAGLVSVFGDTKHQNYVKEYLDILKKSVNSQILIEAKVIEVSLKDEFKSGIDWGMVRREEENDNRKYSFIGGNNLTGIANSEYAPNGFFQYAAQFKNGLGGLIRALQAFGTTKTLSSPRITVMNNQSAVLKVAKNHVYFRINYNKHYYTKNDREDFTLGSDIQTIPIGLVMSVQPSIDPINRNVILFLRPTISKLVDTVVDPCVGIANNQSACDSESSGGKKQDKKIVPESRVPVVEVKEIDSVLQLKDNEVAILGGLMETKATNERRKNPGLGDVPVLKEVFSSLSKEDVVTEVVILIKVKILDSATPDSADERLVHLYTNDPRPFF